MIDLRVVQLTQDRVDDPRPRYGYGLGDVEYHLARNTIIEVCRRHGSAGPVGPARFKMSPSSPYELERVDYDTGDAEPLTFYVIDDQYNSERYIYVELADDVGVTADWLNDLSQTLRWNLQGWGVSIRAGEAGVLLLPPIALVSGSAMDDCNDPVTLLNVLRAEGANARTRLGED